MDPALSEQVQSWFELVLLWIGFGTCVGLLAKALMPGRDPGGAIATLLMGITGVVIGCGVYMLLYNEKISPITSVGLVCGTVGAFVILLFYRLLGGFLLNEAGSTRPLRDAFFARHPHPPVARRRRRRRHSYYLDE
jgi:uncharacterized membrane protein YeaQ/YmgE (transglycosylase-associated protein family)